MQGTLVNLCYTMENHAIATMMTYFGSMDHGLGTEVDRVGDEYQKLARVATDIIYIYIYIYIFTNPSARAGYDTRSTFLSGV